MIGIYSAVRVGNLLTRVTDCDYDLYSFIFNLRVLCSLFIRACEWTMSGVENGVKWSENLVSGSGVVSGHSRKRLSWRGT